jgi:chemotaxis response regulator CheB
MQVLAEAEDGIRTLTLAKELVPQVVVMARSPSLTLK